MEEANKIRDVAARHNYVFDNGLCSPDFFDLDKRMASEEFGLLLLHCQPEHKILEAGCLTGLNLLGLATMGYKHLRGIDFVQGAINWLHEEAAQRDLLIESSCLPLPGTDRTEFVFKSMDKSVDRIICFDVLEHQLNVGVFLQRVADMLVPGARALFLAPEGSHYFDGGHVSFFPNCDCLRNVLDYYFDVIEIRRLESCPKLFAVCERRA